MVSGLSIVIPTRGRVELLARLLKSIRDEATGVDFPVETIIVDDSKGVAREQIIALAEDLGCRFILGGSHVGGKRNLGAEVASHEIVLFLDSDVMLKKGSLSAHHYSLLSKRDDRVAGCLGKVEFTGKATFAWNVISEMQLTLPFSYPDVAEIVPWGPTANISFLRTIFLSIGGFDTTLPRYGGEDVDLGLRLTNAGYIIVTSKDAVAEHSIKTWSTWGQNLNRLISFGRADFYLLVRHPERSFTDFPTGPILWTLQALTIIVIFAISGGRNYSWGLLSLTLTILSYHVVYGLIKRRQDSSFVSHLFGPLIFYTMDLAKAYEALRHRRPRFIVRRLKFLDDLVAQDWPEIAASAWGLTASAFVFFGMTIIEIASLMR